MAHFYVLMGVGDAGKTTTLNKLSMLIQQKSGIAPAIQRRLSNADNLYVFKGAVDKTGKTVDIGIITRGDKEPALRLDTTSLLPSGSCNGGKGCDVIYCACKSQGDTVALLAGYKGAHTVDFIGKAKDAPTIQISENDRIAHLLMDFVL